jgi:hypothetical protein
VPNQKSTGGQNCGTVGQKIETTIRATKVFERNCVLRIKEIEKDPSCLIPMVLLHTHYEQMALCSLLYVLQLG